MSIPCGEYRPWPLPGEQGRDRQIVEALATQLMGWRPARATGNWVKDRVDGSVEFAASVNEWNPLTDWQAAGEVLEKMQQQPDFAWARFIKALYDKSGPFLVRRLTPRLIAEAAFEALKERP